MPGNHNLKTFLDDWTTTYTEAKKLSIFEVGGTQPIRDFLMAISSKESSFADAHLVSFQSKGSENLDLYELIEDFRQHLRLQQLHHSTKGETHSAFSNNSNVKSSF